MDKELFEAIWDPEKDPTDADTKLLQVPPWLQQALDEAHGPPIKGPVIDPQLLALGSKGDVEIWVGRQVLGIVESCTNSNVEIAGDCISDSGDSYYSEDSIASNTDFISFF